MGKESDWAKLKAELQESLMRARLEYTREHDQVLRLQEQLNKKVCDLDLTSLDLFC